MIRAVVSPSTPQGQEVRKILFVELISRVIKNQIRNKLRDTIQKSTDSAFKQQTILRFKKKNFFLQSKFF